MNRRGRQALSPHGEEAYKDLIYLNDAYKRAIIDSQGHEKSSCDVEISLNSLLWNRRGLNICFSKGGQYEKSYSRSYLRFTPGYRFFFSFPNLVIFEMRSMLVAKGNEFM